MELINVTPRELILPGAPKIAGLHFRSFAGPQDLPAMLEVIIPSKLADGLEEGDSLEQITNNYATPGKLQSV